MSKKRSFDKEWCVPSFDDKPIKSKRTPKKPPNMNIIEDMEDSIFDIAIDIIDNKIQNEHVKSCLLEVDEEEFHFASPEGFSLSSLMKSCEPSSSFDLVLSRQKQNEISAWLSSKCSRGRPSIVVISGPSGCGKTLAFKILAQEHGFDISEWVTPIDQSVDEYGRIMRQSDRFLDFLLRATRYSNILCGSSKRLLLIKDLPNIFVDDLPSFFSVLEKYNQLGKDPLVFVCSEGGNSRILTTLFSQNVRDKYNIDLININATTQAAMKKMLKRVSNILNKKGSTFLSVTESHIEEVLANNIGDIRSAILNLIFCSLKVPNSRKSKSECGSREEVLGLLHGIGRVINPKRIVENDSWRFTNDPDEMATFFKSHARTFTYFLHENYMNTMRTIEEVDLAADMLSLADLLNAEWKDPTLNSVTLSLCVRGVMVANQNPVTGWNPVRKPRNTDFDVKRNYEQAEIQWYESIIQKNKPQCEKETANTEIEGSIDEAD